MASEYSDAKRHLQKKAEFIRGILKKKVICIPKVFCLSVGVQIKLDKHAKIDNVYFKLKG